MIIVVDSLSREIVEKYDGVLAGQGDESNLWVTSDWSKNQMFAVQNVDYPKLADYLQAADPEPKVFTIRAATCGRPTQRSK